MSSSCESEHPTLTSDIFTANTKLRPLATEHLRRNPYRPFRFMNLPIEIRLMIAELVLKSDYLAKFRWLSYASFLI